MIKRIKTKEKKNIPLGNSVPRENIIGFENSKRNLVWDGFAKLENLTYWKNDGWKEAELKDISTFDQELKPGYCDRIKVPSNIKVLHKGNIMKMVTTGEENNRIPVFVEGGSVCQ